MRVVLIHSSRTGLSEQLADRFKYPTVHFSRYRYKEGDRLVILGRHMGREEESLLLQNFLINHSNIIIGAIVSDDKNFGYHFGEMEQLFRSLKIPVLAKWDQIVADEKIQRLEGIIDERTRKKNR